MEPAPNREPPPAGPQPPVLRRRRKRAFGALAVVAVLAIVAYVVFDLLTRNQESTDDAQVEADVVPLSARVAAPVLIVHAPDNARVKKNDPLIDLDPTDYQIKVAQAEADLAAAVAQADAAGAQLEIVEATAAGGLTSAQAQVSGSGSSVRSAQAQVAAAQAGLARARADASRAKNDLDRAARLAAEKAIPTAQLDNARSAAASADAQVAQAQAQLSGAEDQARAAQARVGEAQGRLIQSGSVDAQRKAARAAKDLADARRQGAEAALKNAQQQLAYTHIVAPADGTLSRLAVHPGQLVQPGAILAELVPTETYVVANFKETQLARMRPDQEVHISIDAYPGRTLLGRVASLSPGTGARFSLLPPDNATGNFVKVVQRVPVKIVWEKLPADLQPQAGLSAEVTVYLR